MNKIVFTAALVAALSSPHVLQAQGTLYLSSLSQSSTGSQALGSNAWLAEFFVTGINPGGYTLDSIQLGMVNASGSPSGFEVMLYDRSPDPNAIWPGSFVGGLAGSASPSTAGVYTYTPDVNLVLSPNALYFIKN